MDQIAKKCTFYLFIFKWLLVYGSLFIQDFSFRDSRIIRNASIPQIIIYENGVFFFFLISSWENKMMLKSIVYLIWFLDENSIFRPINAYLSIKTFRTASSASREREKNLLLFLNREKERARVLIDWLKLSDSPRCLVENRWKRSEMQLSRLEPH